MSREDISEYENSRPKRTPEDTFGKKEILKAIKTGEDFEFEEETRPLIPNKALEEEKPNIKLPATEKDNPKPENGGLKGLFGGLTKDIKRIKTKKPEEDIPPIDVSLEKLAKGILDRIETKPESKKEIALGWETLIDGWVENKIQREAGKIIEKLRQERRREPMKTIRYYAEENLKIRFKEIFPRIFKDFAVHKVSRGNQETDLDGRVCLGLLHLAGWGRSKEHNVFYVDYNERLKNKVHMDVGKYDGVAFLKEIDGNLELLEFSEKDRLQQEARKHHNLFFRNLGLIIDHHPDGALSASGIVFKLLNKLGIFDNNRNLSPSDYYAIPRMIEFIDIVDSKGFQEVGKPQNWNKSDRTILGLHRFMKFPELLKFFREDGGYNRELTDEELRRYGLIYETEEEGKPKVVNRQKQQRRVIDVSNQKLEEFKNRGFIIDTKFGKMVIDLRKSLPGGAFAAQSMGAGYLHWDRTYKTFFMFSEQELEKNLFEKGFRVRGHLWLIPEDSGETGLTLNKVIEKIGGRVMPNSGLERYLRQESSPP